VPPLAWARPRLRHLGRLDLQIIDGDAALGSLDPATKLVPDACLLGPVTAKVCKMAIRSNVAVRPAETPARSARHFLRSAMSSSRQSQERS
jgi:hypothetical protein